MGTYDDIADEYYDAVLHPTCRNFRELSEIFFQEELVGVLSADSRVLEVGAGASISAPIMHAAGCLLDNLTLLDKSEAMLSYSRRWIEAGAHQVVGDAENTGLRSNSFDLLAASLADPYNSPAFWQEAFRILRPWGKILVTIPSPDWSWNFRKPGELDVAEFTLKGGRQLFVSSLVLSDMEQRKLISSAGLIVEKAISYALTRLSSRISPKLIEAEDGRVLSGFVAYRPS